MEPDDVDMELVTFVLVNVPVRDVDPVDIDADDNEPVTEIDPPIVAFPVVTKIDPVMVNPLLNVHKPPTFRIPPKCVSLTTPNPPMVLIAPDDIDVELVISVLVKVSVRYTAPVEIDTGEKEPVTVREPPTDALPVVANVDVWVDPVTARPPARDDNPPTFRIPPK